MNGILIKVKLYKIHLLKDSLKIRFNFQEPNWVIIQ